MFWKKQGAGVIMDTALLLGLLGLCISPCRLNIQRRHPVYTSFPLIDYDLILMMVSNLCAYVYPCLQPVSTLSC